MRNDAYRISKLKWQLEEKRARGDIYAEWKLSTEQREYLQRMGYSIQPSLFEIQVNYRDIERIKRSKTPLLKKICINKSGKTTVRLNMDQQKELKRLNLSYRIIKYRIFLKTA